MRVLLALALLGFVSCAAPRTRESLQHELEALAQPFEGVVGIYVEHFGSGERASIRADEPFPTASMVKVPILIGIFDKLERGELEWRKPLKWEKRRLYPGEDVLGRFEEGAPVNLSELVTLMCTFSDNTASLWCQELAGGGEAINAWLARNGCETTRVNSRTPGREEAQKTWGWGVTTPREMATLLARIAHGEVVSPAASGEMLRSLSRSYWTGEALSAIPPSVHTASKQGAVNASRSEVVYVDAPHGAYVFCVITRDQKDQSWVHENAGFELLRAVSRACWKHFESGFAVRHPALPEWHR
jgi:beta-lactamase class A